MWPDSHDLKTFLTERVQMDIPILDGSLIETAIEELEAMSGWKPFAATRETVSFDPPGSPAVGALRMGGGSLLALRGRGILHLHSLTLSGQAKTEGTDFWLQNVAGSASTVIRFSRPVWGAPQSIVIDATWGRDCEPCARAKDAVLHLAAGAAIMQSSEQFAGIGSWDEAGVSEKYDSSAIQKAGSRLMDRGRALAAQLQHPGCW